MDSRGILSLLLRNHTMYMGRKGVYWLFYWPLFSVRHPTAALACFRSNWTCV